MENFDPNSERFDLNTAVEPEIYYVIASVPRSGSTLLCNALWNTGISGYPHEYFHDRKHMRILKERWNSNCLESYINRLIIERTSSNGVFGFKAHFYQFNKHLLNIEVEKVLPRLKYIFITRDDSLRQGISFSRAIQTKRWNYYQIEQNKPIYNFQHIEECVHRIQNEENLWKQYFNKNHIHPYHVTYERLISNYSAEIIAILKFLNIELPQNFEITKISTKKQSDSINDEWLSNYKKQKNFLSSIALQKSEKANRDYLKAPKISVEMGCYNFEKYIGEAIESVLAQTLKPYELIISDDHSTDNSWDIISSYAAKYPDLIRAFRTSENIGMKRCSMIRKDMVRGQLLSMIDGDDRWLSQKLELEWKALIENSEAKIAYSNVYIIDELGKRLSVWYDGYGESPPSGDIFIPTFAKKFFKSNRNVFRNPLVFTDVIRKIGYKDLDQNLLHVDWDRKIRMTAENKVAYSGQALVEYRVHGKGIHNTKAHQLYRSANYVIKKNLHLLQNRTFNEIKYVEMNLRKLLFDLSKLANLKSDEIEFPDFQKVVHQKRSVLINSLPKSGTNLLAKLLQLFPGISGTDLHIGHSTINHLNSAHDKNENFVKIGIDFETEVSTDLIYSTLKSMPCNTVATAHIPFSESAAQIISGLGIKMIVILRDPRDVVVSHACYINSSPDHPLYKYYQTLSFDQQVMASINGINDNIKLPDISQRLSSILKWKSQPFVYCTRFEKIIGPKGGGSAKTQMDEIKKIAEYLNLNFDDFQLKSFADNIFGGTKTFRRGKIGAWRDAFTEEHKLAISKIAGDLISKLGYETDGNLLQCPKDIIKEKRKSEKSKYLGNNLIFLISQPRAGSTLLQRLLCGHREIHATAEPWIMLHPLYALKNGGMQSEFDSTLAAQGLKDFTAQIPEGEEVYIEALRLMASKLYNRALEVSGKPIFLDKTPRYYFIIPELKRVFPDAKFIVLLRNPLAVLSSTLKTWFQNSPELLQKSPNFSDIIQGPLYLIKGIHILEKDAVVVKYEELVEDPVNTLKAICYKVGIDYQDKMLDYGANHRPPGKLGDAIGILKHNNAVPWYIDKWTKNLQSPRLCSYSLQYMEQLGSDIFNVMGYSYQQNRRMLEYFLDQENPTISL